VIACIQPVYRLYAGQRESYDIFFLRKRGAAVKKKEAGTPVFSGTVRNGSLALEAYEHLREAITGNVYQPGDYLSENALSEALGMSRTPIREAFKRLSSEGFIETRNGVGTIVTHVTLKEIHDIFEVRSALECVAADSALDRISDKELNLLELTWRKFKADVSAGRKIAWDVLSEKDYMLHEFLIRKCDNRYIIDIIDRIRMKIARFQKISVMTLGDQSDTIDRHLRILELMRGRDVEALKKELRRHILESEELILRNPNLR
jgi:DNA-binding GntR family transcriptional regulator